MSKYATHGLAGLGDGSAKSQSCPPQMTPEVEARVVTIRRAHPGWGQRTIQHQLGQEGISPVPTLSSIYRCRVRQRCSLRGPGNVGMMIIGVGAIAGDGVVAAFGVHCSLSESRRTGARIVCCTIPKPKRGENGRRRVMRKGLVFVSGFAIAMSATAGKAVAAPPEYPHGPGVCMSQVAIEPSFLGVARLGEAVKALAGPGSQGSDVSTAVDGLRGVCGAPPGPGHL